MRELYVVKLQLYVMRIEGELYAAHDYTEAAWRGDDVFLDCTNPRLSLRGDIAACAWRLCCVKRAAICLEIYAGDCVCILCWWSCKDYIGDHSG